MRTVLCTPAARRAAFLLALVAGTAGVAGMTASTADAAASPKVRRATTGTSSLPARSWVQP
jgi:hypothetical protein